MDPEITIAQFICPFYERGHIGKYIEVNQPDKHERLRLVSRINSTLIMRRRAVQQALDTALGLEYLHLLNIIHGDLKEVKSKHDTTRIMIHNSYS